jgi:hypothetical protein
VLRDYPADPPDNLFAITVGQFVSLMEDATGANTWAWQEKLKGLMSGNGILSSDHGGWKFNDAWYGTNGILSTSWTHMSPAAAAVLTSSQLQTNTFFDLTDYIGGPYPPDYSQDLNLCTTAGSSYAKLFRNRILSDTIPCLTLPAGANSVERLAPSGQPDKNTDMQTLENNWPAGRMQTREGSNWHHSDCRAVAYTFTYQLFNQMVTVGNLK